MSRFRSSTTDESTTFLSLVGRSSHTKEHPPLRSYYTTTSQSLSLTTPFLLIIMPPRNTAEYRLEMESGSNNTKDQLVQEYLDEESIKPLLRGTDPLEITPSSSAMDSQQEFWYNARKFVLCCTGLMASYLTWGYMQELIMTSTFTPTEGAPDGKFPSAAFVVFSNRLLAVIVAMIVVKVRHGAVFANNTAPLLSFTPSALSNTISSWSQYKALEYVSFPEQTVFKSSKIIAVMLMGKVLQGKSYPWSKYMEAAIISFGVFLFSYASKKGGDDEEDHQTQVMGLIMLITYVAFDSFTSQYQDKIYKQYGRDKVDPFQMMLGINVSAICMTTFGLIVSGDFLVVWRFLLVNPSALWYNILTAITSASGQISIFYTIQQFGPIVFTIIMTVRQMISICISAVVFGHSIPALGLFGASIVFGVLFNEIRRKYEASKLKKAKSTPGEG